MLKKIPVSLRLPGSRPSGWLIKKLHTVIMARKENLHGGSDTELFPAIMAGKENLHGGSDTDLFPAIMAGKVTCPFAMYKKNAVPVDRDGK